MNRLMPLSLIALLAACSPDAKPPTAVQADSVQSGYALIDAGKPEEAVTLFDRIIAEKPENAAAYTGKGVAFDYAGNHLAAQELYKRALSLSPDSVSIRNDLAMSLILNDQCDEAITLLEELNAQHPGNKTVRQNLALAYGLNNESKKALALNLQDLTPDQAHENMKFYKEYARRLKKLNARDLPARSQIGFQETTASEASTLETAEKKGDKHPLVMPARPPAEPAHDEGDVTGVEVQEDASAGKPAPMETVKTPASDSGDYAYPTTSSKVRY
jgi:tetratricopeptide (TPR) repeat protein